MGFVFSIQTGARLSALQIVTANLEKNHVILQLAIGTWPMSTALWFVRTSNQVDNSGSPENLKKDVIMVYGQFCLTVVIVVAILDFLRQFKSW